VRLCVCDYNTQINECFCHLYLAVICFVTRFAVVECPSAGAILPAPAVI